jgi:hypothetical protein
MPSNFTSEAFFRLLSSILSGTLHQKSSLSPPSTPLWTVVPPHHVKKDRGRFERQNLGPLEMSELPKLKSFLSGKEEANKFFEKNTSRVELFWKGIPSGIEKGHGKNERREGKVEEGEG